MFEWLASPIWGGIGVFVAIASMLSPRAYRAWKRRKRVDSKAEGAIPVPPPSEAYALVNRFVSIYKAHGIERIQVPRFLGEESGLTIAHMGDDEKLLHALSEKTLNDTCARFGVVRDWLDGKPCSIYPRRWYDKSLKGFIDFLERIHAEHDVVEGLAVKCENDNLQHDGRDLPVAFVFRGKLSDWGEQGSESIWRYYPLNDTLFWGYVRTRIQMKAMVLAAWQFGIIIHGCVSAEKNVEDLVEGKVFPGPLLEGTWWAAWHPDAYIFAEGESALVKDGAEALAVRKEMERLGWMDYLVEKTGPLRFPFKKPEISAGDA
jgi:hypothetical protein